MANHITAEEIVTLGKGRVALLANDCLSFLTGPLSQAPCQIKVTVLSSLPSNLLQSLK